MAVGRGILANSIYDFKAERRGGRTVYDAMNRRAVTHLKTLESSEQMKFGSVSIYVLVFLLGFFFASSGTSAEKDCDGTLRWIRGHLYVANGTPSVRIHDTEFRATYGVFLDRGPEHPETSLYPERPILPPDLRNLLSWDARIHGKFLFCIEEVNVHFFDMGFVIKWEGHVVAR